MEDGEVLGHGGRRKAEQFRDLADAQFPSPERQENPHPAGIGQRLGDGHEFAHIVISSNDEMNIARTMTARKRNFQWTVVGRRCCAASLFRLSRTANGRFRPRGNAALPVVCREGYAGNGRPMPKE
jgi:hypothetical protein